MQKKFLFYCLTSMLLGSLTLSSCVDHDYDLDNDISLDVSIGGDSLSIPIGSTDTIRLSNLIDETEFLKTDEDGQYYITQSDSIDPVDISIDPITLETSPISMDPVEINFGVSGINIPAGTPTYTDTVETSVKQSSTFEVNEEVPEEVKAIQSVSLQDSSTIQIALSFDNFPSSIDEAYFKDFYIVLPSFLNFDDSQVTYSGDSAYVKLNEDFNPQNGYSLNLKFGGLDFSKMSGGSLAINDENQLIIDSLNTVSIGGTIGAVISSSDFEDMDNLQITPSVSVGDMSLARVVGKVVPNLDPIYESFGIDIGDDVDFLKNDATLDIHNPLIYLTIGNTIGVSVDADLNIAAKDETGTIIDGADVTIPTQTISGAEVDGTPTYSKFLISKQGTTEDGYTSVQVSDLSSLFSEIPDTLALSIDMAATDTEDYQHVDLTKTMQVTGYYDVDIPLQFDSINIDYDETTDSFHSDLEDFADKLEDGTIVITATVENTIPLDLNLSVIPMNSSDEKISNIKTDVDGTISAATSTDEATSTKITITFSASDGSLSDLDYIKFNISASNAATETAIPLNKDQYVLLKSILLSVQGAVNLDLND